MFNLFTPEQIQNLLDKSTSYRDFFSKLGYENVSGGYRYRELKKYIQTNNLNTDALISNKAIKPKKQKSRKRNIETYLNNEFNISSSKLKIRLLREEILKPLCSICKNIEWCGKPIPLQLDHINGDSSNNNLDNLRLLCPNCHAQTDTYCGKNIKNKKLCKTCNSIPRKNNSIFCSDECRPKIERDKKSKYSTSEIYQIFLDNDSNYTKTSKIVGISDNAIRKRLKNWQGL